MNQRLENRKYLKKYKKLMFTSGRKNNHYDKNKNLDLRLAAPIDGCK